MELGEGLKKILLAGIGTAAVTAEKSKEILDELVKKGELTVEQGMEAAKASVKGLTAAQGYIRHELGRRLHLRKCPELRFIADDSIEKGFALWDKLKELEHED